MRGVISGIVPDGTYGQIAADDGQRYSYWTTEVRNGPVKVGQTVEFQMWEGQPVDIFGVNNPPPPNAAPPQRACRAATAVVRAGRAGRLCAAQRGALPQPPGYVSAAGAGAIPSGSDYWIQLFTSPSGRISRKQFWLHGLLPIFIGNIVLGWIPILGQLISLAAASGPASASASSASTISAIPGWWSLALSHPDAGGRRPFRASASMCTILRQLFWLLAEILFGVGALIGLAQLIFVYIRVGQEGPNQYGPDPLAVCARTIVDSHRPGSSRGDAGSHTPCDESRSAGPIRSPPALGTRSTHDHRSQQSPGRADSLVLTAKSANKVQFFDAGDARQDRRDRHAGAPRTS